jgi:predicted GNAT family acetyltransferase
MNIIQYKPHYSGFYAHIGKFAMNPEVVKEFDNYPIVTGKDWIWYLAIEGEMCVGFLAYSVSGKKLKLEQMYVIPDLRKKGVCQKLYDAFLKNVEGEAYEMHCVATNLGNPFLLKNGWQTTKSFVKWHNMVKK